MWETLRRSLPLLPLSAMQPFGRLIVTVLLARWMGAENFGAFATLYVLIEVLSQPATLGLGQGVVRYGAGYFKQAEQALLRGLHRFAWFAVVTAGSGITLLLVLISAPLVSGTATHEGLRYLLIAVPLAALVQVQASYLLATKRKQDFLLTRQVLAQWFTIVAALVILLSVDTVTVHEALWAVILGFSFTLLYQWSRLRGELRGIAPAYRTREWLTAALPLMLSASGTALIVRLDILFARIIENEAAVALYLPPAVIAGLTMIPVNAIGTVCRPRLAAAVDQGTGVGFRTDVVQMARALTLANTVVVLVVALLGPWLLLLYGEHHAAIAMPLLLIMLAGRLVLPFRVVSSALLKLVGNPWLSTLSFVIGSVATIAAALVLHRYWGLEGLAAGFAVGFAVGVAASLLLVRRSLGIPLSVMCGMRGDKVSMP